MTDPRTDLTRRPNSNGSMWGWIAGIAVLVLVAIVLIAGWNNETNTATNAPLNPPAANAPAPPATTGAAPTAPSPAPVPPNPSNQ